MPELPIVNTNYRNLSNGDPGQALSFQRDGMANAANSVPNPNSLGSQVMDMLRQYQSGFQNTANQAQRQQAVRGASTPSNLIGADPSLQRFVRSSSQMALEPTIGGARAAISEAGEAIARLGQLRQEEENRTLQLKAEKKQNIDLLIATGTADDIAQFLATSPETFKEAGYDPKAIASILPALKLKEQRETAMFNRSMAPSGNSSGFDPDKLLTISEAKDLGVPYGTTHGQAIELQGSSAGGESAQAEKLKGKIALVDDLKSHGGLNSRVGPTGLARGKLSIFDRFGAGQEFAGGVQQLVGKETIDELVNLKERGGTLGALSDKERELLEQSATKIGSWAIKDENGFNTGEYNVSEKAFKEELDKISDLAKTAYERHTGVPYQSAQQTANSYLSPSGNSYTLPY